MEYRRRRLVFSLLVLICLLAIVVFLLVSAKNAHWLNNTSSRISNGQPGLYRVTQFIDGDTIAVDMNGTQETIRMIGVDTPETHRPETPVQCYGPEASNYTKKLVGDSKVRLTADPLNTNRDRYDRLLRYVYLPDGTLVEASLIKNGYGFAYTSFPFEKRDEFTAYELSAKSAGTGLWSACTVTVRSNGVQQTNPAR